MALLRKPRAPLMVERAPLMVERAPARLHAAVLHIRIDALDAETLARAVATGFYGETAADCAAMAVARWCEARRQTEATERAIAERRRLRAEGKEEEHRP